MTDKNKETKKLSANELLIAILTQSEKQGLSLAQIKEKHKDYIRNNQDIIFDAFDEICIKMQRQGHKYNLATTIQLFEICPDAAQYKKEDSNGMYRSFLRSALESKQEQLCEYLLSHGCCPVEFIDKYGLSTIYDAAFLQLNRKPTDAGMQNIMNLFRKYVPLKKQKFWQEKEEFLTNRARKSTYADQAICGGTIALIAFSIFIAGKVTAAFGKEEISVIKGSLFQSERLEMYFRNKIQMLKQR